MPQWWKGTIGLLQNMAAQTQRQRMLEQSPLYRQQVENLMLQHEQNLLKKTALEGIKTAQTPQEAMKYLKLLDPAGFLDIQQMREREGWQVRRERERTATQFDISPEQTKEFLESGVLPAGAKYKMRQIYDPYTRALLSTRGREAAQAQVELTGVEAISKDVEDVLNHFRKIPSVYTGPAAGRTIGQIGKVAQFSPDLAAFEDVKELTLSNIAKKLGGEVGVLTDRDIIRIKNALPALRDTKETANKKIKFVLNYIDRRIKAKQRIANMGPTGLAIEGTNWYEPNFNENRIPVKIQSQSQSIIDKLRKEGKLP